VTERAAWACDGPWKAAGVLAVALAVASLALDARAQAVPAAAEAERPTLIQAPHYGDTLWRFYQGKTFSAITSLMTSQQVGRIVPHDDESEVLRGGMLLSYGLHQEAGKLFTRLIERGAPPSVQDRAWFYLAKIRFQRGAPADAEQALAQVGERLPAALEEDRLLLAAQLRMARQDHAGAAELLREVADAAGKPADMNPITNAQPKRRWFSRSETPAEARARVAVSPWLRFNLGVALLRQGDGERGVPLLVSVGKAPPASSKAEEESGDLRSLRDQANLALGYWALQAGNGADAREHLSRVRLHALHANRALLGFGWAASTQKEHEKSLVAWTELAGRDPSDAAVLEARIAVPYAYAELGALGQAQTHYTAALDAYGQERQALATSIAAVKRGEWLTRLLEANPGEEMGWFWQIGTLPSADGSGTVADIPHPGHIAPLLAEHDFQEALKNLRDLSFLQRNLAAWQEQIVAMQDLLQHRERVFAERLPNVQGAARSVVDERLAKVRERVAALTAEVTAAEAAGDGLAYADARQAALLRRIDAVRAQLAQLAEQGKADQKAEASPDAADKLRLTAGALAWDLAHQLPARQRQAHKGLAASDEALAEAGRRVEALNRAQQEEPARFAAFGQRIAALDARIRTVQPVLAQLGDEQRAQVQQLAVAAFERQQQRLDEYTLQARFALAQLQDRAVVSSAGATDAPAR
jgi:hypothetical protein